MKPVFGGFETRLKFIKFKLWIKVFAWFFYGFAKSSFLTPGNHGCNKNDSINSEQSSLKSYSSWQPCIKKSHLVRFHLLWSTSTKLSVCTAVICGTLTEERASFSRECDKWKYFLKIFLVTWTQWRYLMEQAGHFYQGNYKWTEIFTVLYQLGK